MKFIESFFFGSLESAFANKEQIKYASAISMLIEESLKSELDNSIEFANAILKNENNLKAKKECFIA